MRSTNYKAVQHVTDWRMVPSTEPVKEYRRYAREYNVQPIAFWVAGVIGALLGLAVRIAAGGAW